MTTRGGKVHGILSFRIEYIDDEGRSALQQQLSTLIQAHPTWRIEVSAFEKGLIVSGDDELELMEFREKIASRSEHMRADDQLQRVDPVRYPSIARPAID